jgi:hypothetical protein
VFHISRGLPPDDPTTGPRQLVADVAADGNDDTRRTARPPVSTGPDPPVHPHRAPGTLALPGRPHRHYHDGAKLATPDVDTATWPGAGAARRQTIWRAPLWSDPNGYPAVAAL